MHASNAEKRLLLTSLLLVMVDAGAVPATASLHCLRLAGTNTETRRQIKVLIFPCSLRPTLEWVQVGLLPTGCPKTVTLLVQSCYQHCSCFEISSTAVVDALSSCNSTLQVETKSEII